MNKRDTSLTPPSVIDSAPLMADETSRRKVSQIATPSDAKPLAFERDDVAAFLDHLFRMKGDPAYLRASRSLFQLPPGATPIDDSYALEEIQAILASGGEKTLWAACMRVAKARCRGQNPRSTAERYRRKCEKENISSTNRCVDSKDS